MSIGALVATSGVAGRTRAATRAPAVLQGGSPVPSTGNKAVITAMIQSLIAQRDPTAVGRYIATDYAGHGTHLGGTVEDVRAFVAQLKAGTRYDLVRIFSDGAFVATHGRYTGLATTPLVAIEIFRIDQGKVIEHWAGVQAEGAPNASGHTMLDGPAESDAPAATAANRLLVEDFATTVLIGGQFDRITDYISTETYIQHNPGIADGLTGMAVAMDALAAQGQTVRYDRLHLTVAEGDFVLMLLEGVFGGPAAYFDLFRIERGRIVEHWDVIQTVPEDLPHDNGMF
jgi:predicted SnoaL-like aldol condensation-catalyzing enzyme